MHLYVPPLSLPTREHDAFGNGDNRRSFVLPLATTQQGQSARQVYITRYERGDIRRNTNDCVRNGDVSNERNCARNIRNEL